MAVTKNDSVIIMTAVGDEIATAVRVRAVRWVGAMAAGDGLELRESSSGDTSAVLWESEAAGANYVEESAVLAGVTLPMGIRIGVIDSGTVYLYLGGR